MSGWVLVAIVALLTGFSLWLVFREAKREMDSRVRSWPATPPLDDFDADEWQRRQL